MHAVIESPRVESFSSSYSSTDSITMGQQHRPIVRKRSLAELPGNIRVPVFKKPDRLKSRLEASLAGLKELQTLREKHQVMVNQAMTSFKSPLNTSANDTKETQLSSTQNTEEIEHGQNEGFTNMDSTHSLSQLWRDTFGESDLPTQTDNTSPDKDVPAMGDDLAVDSISSESKDIGTEVTISESKAQDTVDSETNSDNGAETETPVPNPKAEVSDSSEECSVNTETSTAKSVLRPRSMSLCHFPKARKFQQESKTKNSGISTRSSADDLLSGEGPKSSNLKRKGSIFEGVDINIQGPNPVHAILMQYGPLSSTQSMPSVCATLPRRHTVSLSTSSNGLRCNSETSSSRESVFSRTETVTSTTQTEDAPPCKTTQDVGTQPCDITEDIYEQPVLNQSSSRTNERSTESAIVSIKSQPYLNKFSTVHRAIPFRSDSRLHISQTKVMKDRNNSDSLNTGKNLLKSENNSNENDPELKLRSSQSNSPSRNITSQSFSRKTISSDSCIDMSNTSYKVNSRSTSLPSHNRPTLRSLPITDHGSVGNIRERSGSVSRVQQNSRLSHSSGNLSPRALTLPKNCSSINLDNQYSKKASTLPCQASSIPPLPRGAKEGKKVRRFGLPLDSKLLHNMLARQEKCQPIKSEKSENTSKRRNSLKSISSKLLFLKDKVKAQEKENSFVSKQSCPMDMSNDEYGMTRLLEIGNKSDLADSDDEYGMAMLLDSSKTLTSTPVMAKKPMTAKHSFVSDEGYCPSQENSPPVNRRRSHHHKISIRSDNTWISSDMEENDLCSGEISPYSVTTPTTTRFNFNDFTTSTPHRRKESRDSNRIISSRARISPDWDSFSQKSSSVSLLSISTDVPESCL